jgi:hypothetical protein
MTAALVHSLTSRVLLEAPGVGPGSARRPTKFEDYLIGIGLAPRTVTRYRERIRWAERTAGELGFTLATADARGLAALSVLTGASHPMRAQLRCALKHWYEYQDRSDAPLRAVRVPPAPRMVNKALDVDLDGRPYICTTINGARLFVQTPDQHRANPPEEGGFGSGMPVARKG